MKDYLVSGGYDGNKIQVDGKGESEPKVPNTSEANRFINRRVVFVPVD